MENKTLAYMGFGVILLLLFGTFAMGGMGSMNGKAVSNMDNVDNMADHHRGKQPVVSNVIGDMSDHPKGSEQLVSLNSEELAKYRSENIPEDCRLADYDNDVKKWAEHLSHHENTMYCLEYFDDIIVPKISESFSDSSGIPEKCRQPSGRDRDSWKEHLSHHQETEECLKYFD